MLKELRRNQDSLRIAGIGIIALSVWSVIKAVLLVELDTEKFERLFGALLGDSYEKAPALFVLFLFLAVDLLLRAFVGCKARKEGKGGKGGIFYLVINAAFILTAAYNLIYAFVPDAVSLSRVDTLVDIIFELTTLYTCICILYASIKVKILKKRQTGGN